MREITYRDAIREALNQALAGDDRVFLMGEDIGEWGGPWGVTEGLIHKFGAERVRNTPVAENAILGCGIGSALGGMRPIVEIMSSDFIFAAFNEVINDAAKWRHQHNALVNVPLVIRAPVGTIDGQGPEHSQSPEAYFMHTPGLKVVLPSTPYDAKGLMNSALADGNPVLFFEHKRLYPMKGEVPEEPYQVPIGVSRIAKEGNDVTIVSWSLTLHKCLEAAKELHNNGVDAEVIDLRSVLPLDMEAVRKSVSKTGRLVVAEEASKTGGVGAEIAAAMLETCYDRLEAPVVRVALPDAPIPFNVKLEHMVVPSPERIVQAVNSVMTYRSKAS